MTLLLKILYHRSSTWKHPDNLLLFLRSSLTKFAAKEHSYVYSVRNYFLREHLIVDIKIASSQEQYSVVCLIFFFLVIGDNFSNCASQEQIGRQTSLLFTKASALGRGFCFVLDRPKATEVEYQAFGKLVMVSPGFTGSFLKALSFCIWDSPCSSCVLQSFCLCFERS